MVLAGRCAGSLRRGRNPLRHIRSANEVSIAPELFGSSIRWFTAVGAVMALALLSRWTWLRYAHDQRIERASSLYMVLVGTVLCLTFFALAGAAIPFSLQGRALTDEAMRAIMRGIWPIAAVGCWLVAIGLAHRRLIMLTASILFAAAMFFAAAGTSHEVT